MVKISAFDIFADESTETFLGGLSSLLLPETRGKQLPDDEGEEEDRWEGGGTLEIVGMKSDWTPNSEHRGPESYWAAHHIYDKNRLRMKSFYKAAFFL